MAPSRGERASAAPTSPWIALLMLWLAGFRDACRFDRAFLICRRSGVVRKKTGQCFLNGLLVLGSVLVLQKAIIPALSWLLDFEAHVDDGSARPVPKLQSFLIALYYVLWLYPIYVISFVINCIHSNEIAQHVFHEVKKTMNEPTSRPSTGTSSTAAAFDSFHALGPVSLVESVRTCTRSSSSVPFLPKHSLQVSFRMSGNSCTSFSCPGFMLTIALSTNGA
ncbi:protein EI24 homolog [Selaginella moellendorffii]|uniref:protein EI24 homolog n=1 Tax=Selaginella moellendorffii TaxID=88036 RepID=UPI000D1C93C6|nr:protein EI24 homolog [Selaginella moellendorffii]|eukprot:XP_024544809.1 protein EI24 homolog [Selaginella moellendorffii]